MNIVYPDLPAEVYQDQVLEAIRSLGFDPNQLRSLLIERRGVEATVMLADKNGKRFAAGDEVATVTVRLPVTDRAFDRTTAVA